MSQPQPILSHMPWHVKKQIVNNLHSRDRLSIRECSREFKKYVDLTEIRYDSLLFWWSADEKKIRIRWFDEINEKMIMFQKKPMGYSKEDYPRTWSKNVEERSYTHAAVEQFMTMLRRPRVVVGDLSITFGDSTEYWREDKIQILKAFKSELLQLDHQLEVERLRMTTGPHQNDILHVLPYLKPGTLKTIRLNPMMSRSDCAAGTVFEINVSELAELEQWKQAEALFLGKDYVELPEDQTANFKAISHFSMFWDVDQVEAMIMDVLQNEGYDWLKVYYSPCHFQVIHQYLSQFDVLPQKVLSRQITYRTQMDDTECLIKVCDDFRHVTVWNPKKCEGKQYY